MATMSMATTAAARAPRQPDPYVAAVERRAAAIEARVTRRHLKPPPRLTLSQWADRFGMLSPEGSARPGPFSVAEAPYQREPMDVIGNPAIPLVILKWSSQVGKTQILTLYLGYIIDQDPGPILNVQPTLELAEAFSKDRIAPALRDTPRLRNKVKDIRSRSSDNTLLRKGFSGGQLTLAGANSPAGLAARAIRYLQLDEVDRFPASAGKEGSPSSVAESRTSTFSNAKIIKASSPTIEGESEIEEAYQQSDQREYWVPCPHCQHEQLLVFGGRDLEHGLKWEKLPNGDVHAYYVCEACGAISEEADKRWMLAHGRWIAGKPEHDVPGFCINAIYSPFFSWKRLVKRWLRDKGDPLKLQGFVNTILCELWRVLAGERLDPESLAGRLEAFQPRLLDPETGQPTIPEAPEADRSFVPAKAALIVRAVDTQDDRLETAVWAFGAGEECWLIDFDMIPGDTSIPFGNPMSPWNELDDMIRHRQYRHEGGVPMRCFPTFVDSGGHSTKEVYAFTKSRNRLGVFATKGLSEQSHGPLLGKPTRNNSAKAILYPVGSYSGKESVWKRLAKIKEPGPGYIHLPDWLSGEQISQFTNEELKRKLIGGRPKYMWIQKGPTEMFHLAVYALVALQLHPLNTRQNLGELAAQLMTQGAAQPEQPAAETSTEEAFDGTPKRAARKVNWVNRWRG